MQGREFDVVTGAFGYTGKYITRRLLAMGRGVRTLTGHPERGGAFNGDVEVAPLQFERPDKLTASLRGASTLYNTYWVRFPRGQVTYEKAVENTRALINAAREAGVERIVHLSITNPFADSTLGYFAGKSAIERMISDSGLAYAILRPTVIFGVEDVLINNIAWLLRHAPVFAIPGSGEYPVQPIYVVDLAEMAVTAGRATERATGVLPVPEHGQDGHATTQERATGILPVPEHGQDGHGTTSERATGILPVTETWPGWPWHIKPRTRMHEHRPRRRGPGDLYLRGIGAADRRQSRQQRQNSSRAAVHGAVTVTPGGSCRA